MAHAHETQAKISLLKKSPAIRAQDLCAAVRKIFIACQENIYSLSRKYLELIQKIFTVCRKDFHCTVRNILRVQSETFCVYSQKHSACTVRKIPAVLAGKSPQIARISRLATIFALLFCVCGGARAWGQTVYTWTGNGSNNLWSDPKNWQYDTSDPAKEAPGDKLDATVTIDNGDTVTLDKPLENALSMLMLDNTSTLTLKENLSATFIQASNDCKLDLVNCNLESDYIALYGTTIRLYGTQNITSQYISADIVEFYGDTGTIPIKVSKMAASGTNFSTLVCNLSNSNDQKVLDFTGIKDIGTLTLNGNDRNKLGITATSPTTINITTKVDKASNLRVNYNNVNLTRQVCDLTDRTSVVTAADFTGNYTMRGTWNGWKFSDGDFANTYYWVGGNGNWSEYNAHWRYVGTDGPPVNEAPGTKANAEVHITTGGTVTFNVTSQANELASIEISNGATLAIGANTLAIATNGSWTNGTTAGTGGTVTLTTGSVNLPTNITENGTWTYTVTRTGLVPLSYNVLNLYGSAANTTITPTAAVTANSVSINANTTLALDANALTVRNLWSNNNGTVTVTSGNATLPAGTTDSGTWTYTVTRTGLVPLSYNVLNLYGSAANTTITPTAAVTANSVSINANTTLALDANALTVRNLWSNNNGTVTVTSGSATLPSGATDNGTWTYNNTSPHDLVNISYNILNLNGTGTITPIAAITANRININNGTTLALGANNLTVRNLWTNNGIVTVTSGNATLPNGATDSGTWNYNNTSSRALANLKYKTLNLNGTGDVAAAADVSAETITIANGATLDLVNRNLAVTTSLTNNGTVRLYGTQNVSGAITNAGANGGADTSTVEYYGTGIGDVSKFGNSYYDLVCTTPGKTLHFNNNKTTVQHYLTLRGSAESPITINTERASVMIDVKARQGESLTSVPPAGRYLLVNRAAVRMTGTTSLGKSASGEDYYYYAEDSFDTNEDDVLAIRNGWRLKMIELDPVSIALSPVGSNTLYVRTNTANMGSLTSSVARRRLPRYFTIVVPNVPNPIPSARQQNVQIVYSTEARFVTSASGAPIWIALTLNTSTKVEHFSSYYIRETMKDDKISFHALSDFAIGVVETKYAFDNRHLDSGNAEEATGGVAIRNWDKDQEKNGQLVTQSDITISAGRNVDGLGVPVVYFDATPDAASVSSTYNSDTGGDWRIWLPQAFDGLAPVANSEYITFEEGAAVGGSSLRFDLPAGNDGKFSSWKEGSQISFLFELKNADGDGITICHEPVINGTGTELDTSATSPLYALRLRNAENITTLDLWSFKLRDITAQRGSITIMNNVINVLSGENMILDVNVPVSGVLNIMVMTLDGTIVKYLQHGSTSQGKHVYHWDGRNNAGKPVARGMYFIRIVGCTIDESRKVMAVWQ